MYQWLEYYDIMDMVVHAFSLLYMCICQGKLRDSVLECSSASEETILLEGWNHKICLICLDRNLKAAGFYNKKEDWIVHGTICENDTDYLAWWLK